MSSQPSVAVAASSDEDGVARTPAQSTEPMSSGHDTELATIFREMRRAMGVSRERIAGRLAISVETIDTLENGDLLALPDWSEVSRIVTAYTAQLGLDARPILRRMKAQIDVLKSERPSQGAPEAVAGGPAIDPAPQPAVHQTPDAQMETKAVPAGAGPDASFPDAVFDASDVSPLEAQLSQASGSAEPAGTLAAQKARATRLMRASGSWLALFGLACVLGTGLWFAAQNPKTVWSAVDSLPDPIPGAMRSAWDLIRPLDEPEPRPQISDPDNRKSDKLP